MTGRECLSEERVVTESTPDAPVLLDVKNLTRARRFQRRRASRYGPARSSGITGLLGSGRSEIAEAIFGIHPADCGNPRRRRGAHSIRSIRDAVEGRHRLRARGPAHPGTVSRRLHRRQHGGLVARLVPHAQSACSTASGIRESIADLFKRLRIQAPNVGAVVRSLSGGNAQRVVLAKWLDRKPSILVLNGPTVGVDIGSKEEIIAILREQAAAGMGVIVISDDIPELVSSCHRILIVHEGRIVAELAGDEIDAARDSAEDGGMSGSTRTAAGRQQRGSARRGDPRRRGGDGNRRPAFFTPGTFFALVRSSMVPLVFALGVLLVMISGGIDVSFPAIAIFAAYATVKWVGGGQSLTPASW